jgi:hypothetical protein
MAIEKSKKSTQLINFYMSYANFSIRLQPIAMCDSPSAMLLGETHVEGRNLTAREDRPRRDFIRYASE